MCSDKRWRSIARKKYTYFGSTYHKRRSSHHQCHFYTVMPPLTRTRYGSEDPPGRRGHSGYELGSASIIDATAGLEKCLLRVTCTRTVVDGVKTARVHAQKGLRALRSLIRSLTLQSRAKKICIVILDHEPKNRVAKPGRTQNRSSKALRSGPSEMSLPKPP